MLWAIRHTERDIMPPHLRMELFAAEILGHDVRQLGLGQRPCRHNDYMMFHNIESIFWVFGVEIAKCQRPFFLALEPFCYSLRSVPKDSGSGKGIF